MQDDCLGHSDFFIGREFWTPAGRWRCTDMGTRTICAGSSDTGSSAQFLYRLHHFM